MDSECRMDDANYARFSSQFDRYGVITTIRAEDNDLNVYSLHGQKYSIGAERLIAFRANLSLTGFYELSEDINRANESRKEEFIRSNNPVLQRAYEDYQLLLKLSQ